MANGESLVRWYLHLFIAGTSEGHPMNYKKIKIKVELPKLQA